MARWPRLFSLFGLIVVFSLEPWYRRRLPFATNLLLGGRVIVQRQPLAVFRSFQGRPPVVDPLSTWRVDRAGGL